MSSVQTLSPFTLPPEARKSLKENRRYSSHLPKKKTVIDTILYYFFLGLALSGFIPVITFFIEHNLAGLHAFSNHLKKCKNYCPRVSVVIPAWNEGLVIEHTLSILLKMDYPLDKIRIYVVNDGSTDDTAETLDKYMKEYPDNVFHVYKESGGKGKAHAVNYGLDVILSNDWAEAILLIDADISFKKDALRRMTRHLADPQIGAVTGYIKVGNRKTNYISRSVGYEYIVSQAIARRAQNVLGVVACLAGGAQLHTRTNIENLGGKIDTSTLAEDTYTTFATQKMGKKVIYEGNAFVYAEEPKTILDIWKQRFRWARGNIQITKAFKGIWFRHRYSGLGGFLFAIIWFCVLLTPILMICSAIGFVGLFIVSKNETASIFYYLASVSFFLYLYTTFFALFVDRRTSKLSWIEGFFYPGIISLCILIFSMSPELYFRIIRYIFSIENDQYVRDGMLLFFVTWSAFCMFWAWVVFRLEVLGISDKVSNILLFIVGYGPFLCTINLAAYIAEIKKPTLKWDKTDKIATKRPLYPHHVEIKPFNFDQALDKDQRREYRFFCRQILSFFMVSLLLYIFYHVL